MSIGTVGTNCVVDESTVVEVFSRKGVTILGSLTFLIPLRESPWGSVRLTLCNRKESTLVKG